MEINFRERDRDGHLICPLKVLRETLGWTQKDLEWKMGYKSSGSYFGYLEQGRKPMNRPLARKIAETFDFDVRDFMEATYEWEQEAIKLAEERMGEQVERIPNYRNGEKPE